MSKVEEVARALAEDNDHHDEFEIGDFRDAYMDMARAAIGAMISPTPGMIAAADAAMRHRRMDGEERLVTLRDGLAAAIDAALSEEGR